VRLLVDWAALQPSAQTPPDLAGAVDGCARGVGPCGTYEGIAGTLAAIASQQRAARAEGRPGFEVVVDVFGAPAWAALPPHGCELAGASSFMRPLAPAALGAYRNLIAALISLARSKGVALPWWSAWNEPNDPRFLSPQRAGCDAHGTPLATAVYAQLARAMSAELKQADPGAQMLLGELGGYDSGSAHRLSVEEFVASLPPDVLCLSDTWAVHAYAAYGRRGPAERDPVTALESALDARGGCATSAHVWVTEAGAGAPDPGRARTAAAGEGRDGCLALATQVLRWRADPRVAAVFQYEFRDDPAFPVGLASADLKSLEPTYRVWLALSSAAPVDGAAALCGG
jgi:hypothetical protein